MRSPFLCRSFASWSHTPAKMAPTAVSFPSAGIPTSLAPDASSKFSSHWPNVRSSGLAPSASVPTSELGPLLPGSSHGSTSTPSEETGDGGGAGGAGAAAWRVEAGFPPLIAIRQPAAFAAHVGLRTVFHHAESVGFELLLLLLLKEESSNRRKHCCCRSLETALPWSIQDRL